MQDFLLNDEDRAFRSEVREFLDAELLPRASAIENDRQWCSITKVVRELGKAGYLRLMFPELYRGTLSQPGVTHATILSEESAAINYAFETTIATALSCAYPLYRHASESIRDRFLPGIIDGIDIGAICVTESNAGSDSSGMVTRIEHDASNDEYVINGFKRYISNASKAHTYIVYGVTDSSTSAQKGMSAVVVADGTPGMSFPGNYTFLGRNGCVVGEVEFSDCRVPASHLVGELHNGFQVMLEMFNFERIILGGAGLGVARSAFEIACNHAQTRTSFGQKLGEKQLIWNMVAEMSWRIDATELLTYRAAKQYDSGRLRPRQLMRAASMAKLVASETAVFCADRTVQVLGGDGYTKEYGRAEQIYRDARALPIVGGTSEIVKYLIARADLPELDLTL